jgi:hypothetical protein
LWQQEALGQTDKDWVKQCNEQTLLPKHYIYISFHGRVKPKKGATLRKSRQIKVSSSHKITRDGLQQERGNDKGHMSEEHPIKGGQI